MLQLLNLIDKTFFWTLRSSHIFTCGIPVENVVEAPSTACGNWNSKDWESEDSSKRKLPIPGGFWIGRANVSFTLPSFLIGYSCATSARLTVLGDKGFEAESYAG